jgi:hypothetical protein
MAAHLATMRAVALPVATASLASLLLALWLEAVYKFVVTWDPGNFVGAVLVYALVLPPAQLLMRLLPKVPDRLWLLFWGGLGLLAEWFVIGNSPWGNPAALHSAMFAFHGSYPVWGRILGSGPSGQRSAGLALWAGFTLLTLGGLLLGGDDLRRAWALLVPLGLYYALAAITLTGWPARRRPLPQTVGFR